MNKPEIIPYLDTTEAVREYDQSNIAGVLVDFSNQLSQALTEFSKVDLPETFSEVKQVVFCGMGGSAIGAQVACDVPAQLKRKPLLVINDYDLPHWIGSETAVVVISYSGQTAEALSCYDQALQVGALIVVISSGGELIKKAQQNKSPLYKFEYKSEPRDALGYLFVPAITLLVKAQVLTANEANIKPAIKLIGELGVLYEPTTPTVQNIAKQLAYRLFDRVPIIIGSSLTRSAARRWKNQINEHSKGASWFDELPEANHNTVEGFGWPARFKDDVAIIFLETEFDNPAVVKRQELWKEHLVHQGVQVEAVEAKGDDIWSNKLSLIYLGDWVSYYLALLNHVDPEDIPIIRELKNKLSQS